MESMDVPSEWDENFSVLHPVSAVVSGGWGDKMTNVLPSSPGVQLCSLPNQLSLLPNGGLSLDYLLGSDLELPGDAILSNICLVPPGHPCDLLGQNLGCHLPAKIAQTTAPITARKEDGGAVACQ